MKALLISSILGLALLLSPDAHARLFLVEVIVVGHPDGRADQRVSDELRDFTPLLDPLWIAGLRVETTPEINDELAEGLLLDDLTVSNDQNETIQAEHQDESGPAQSTIGHLTEYRMPDDLGKWLEQGAPVFPVTFSQQPALSREMNQAWQRINNNPGFEALAWRAWIQPVERGQPSPAVRIHDETVIGGNWAGAFELPEGLIAPWPQSHFRLDGSLRLVQRQFLHAELDFDWRLPANYGDTDQPPVLLANHRYRVHRLEQSRTIRPDRMEYFDSSRIGVLLKIRALDSD